MILLCIVILFLQITYKRCLILPSILWDPDNPIFNEKQCHKDSTEFFGKWNDEITILCGSRELILYPTMLIKNLFYYNVFITTRKEAYDRRDSKLAELFHKCVPTWDTESERFTIDTKHFVFRKESYTNHTFYFFTTSDGRRSSLNNECGVKESRNMKFSIFICPENDKLCIAKRNRINLCL